MNHELLGILAHGGSCWVTEPAPIPPPTKPAALILASSPPCPTLPQAVLPATLSYGDVETRRRTTPRVSFVGAKQARFPSPLLLLLLLLLLRLLALLVLLAVMVVMVLMALLSNKTTTLFEKV